MSWPIAGSIRKRFIQAIRQIRKQALRVVWGDPKAKRKYGYRGAQIDAYESLGLLFKEILAELREKHLAERLWKLFEELLQAVFTSMSDSGSVDLQQFQSSPQYIGLKDLFEAFLEKSIAKSQYGRLNRQSGIARSEGAQGLPASSASESTGLRGGETQDFTCPASAECWHGLL